MFTFSEMLALVESESSFGAYVCHRRPGGYRATSDLVKLLVLANLYNKEKKTNIARSAARKASGFNNVCLIFCVRGRP